jgi:hypothetical protein
LNVTRGKVTDFIIDFIMVHTDGTTFHTHQLNNFKADSVIPVLLNPDGTTVISGMVDVRLNGNVKWTNVHTIVLINSMQLVLIHLIMLQRTTSKDRQSMVLLHHLLIIMVIR